jgi:hypothetical protein
MQLGRQSAMADRGGLTMNTMRTATLPSGGPLRIDIAVADLFLAQLDIMCAPLNNQREKEAIGRRKVILESLDTTQRRHAKTVCSILLRLLDLRPAHNRAA